MFAQIDGRFGTIPLKLNVNTFMLVHLCIFFKHLMFWGFGFMDCRAALSMNIWFFIQPIMTKPLPSWRAKRGHPSLRRAVMDCHATLAVTGNGSQRRHF